MSYCIEVLGADIFCIPYYVIFGLIGILVGVLLAIFFPSFKGRMIGGAVALLSLLTMFFFDWFFGMWDSSESFRVFVFGAVIFAIILLILFAGGSDGSDNGA